MTTSAAVDKSRWVSPAASNHLWGRWLDVLLLGGLSVVAFVVLQLVQPSAAQATAIGAAMMSLAHLVNHPHFAHSYQIFYASWWKQGGATASATRWRWWWAGAIAPAVLAAVIGLAAWRAVAGDLVWMGLCISAMALLVGWHYVKQGFGMAMTDAALQRCWWPPAARRALLFNAYVCWGVAWVLVNFSEAGRAYWGYFAWQPPVPGGLAAVAAVIGLASTLWTAVVLARAWREMASRQPQRSLPVAGLVAYVVTLYLWTVFAAADPTYLLMIPFFHSLQYLTVVWRYKLNEWRADGRPVGMARPMRFLGVGLVMGAAGFWWVPVGLEALRTGMIDFDPKGPALALACFWLFINVHHYLIDNVLWRKDNPNVDRYLFGRMAPSP